MRPLSLSLAIALALGLAQVAQAAPVTARFNGQVSGFDFGFLDPNAVGFDDQHPVGTLVDWEMRFDDALLTMSIGELSAHGPFALQGHLQLGNQHYDLSGLSIFSLLLENDFNTIIEYRVQVTGTGPDTQDGADFFGVWWGFDRQLQMTGQSLIGWDYAFPNANVYGYLATSGEYQLQRGSVPEPAGLALLALGAAAAVTRRRRGVGAQNAR